MPEELRLLGLVDRFGAQAIYGRPLRAGEVRAMTLAERVVLAQASWKAAEDADKWAEWANSHPGEHAMLARIMLEVASGNHE